MKPAGRKALGCGAPLAVVQLGKVHEVHVDVEIPDPLLIQKRVACVDGIKQQVVILICQLILPA